MPLRLSFLAALLLFLSGAARAHWPYGIVAEGNGGAVFLRWPRKEVVRVAADGDWSVLADLSAVSGDAYPHALARGPDGALYVAATYAPKMWRIGPDGDVSEHSPVPDRDALPPGNWLNLAFGPKGRMHLVLSDEEKDDEGRVLRATNRIVRIEGDGSVTGLYEAGTGEDGYVALYGSCVCVTADGEVRLTSGRRLLRIADDGAPEVVAEKGLGRLWGLVPHPAGGVLALDRAGGRVLRVGREGDVTEVASGLERAWGLARLGDGRILIAEEPEPSVYRIRRFTPGEGLETVVIVKSE